MTFAIETRQRYRFNVEHDGEKYEIQHDYALYWVFEFANGDIETIIGSVLETDAEFEIPNAFFTEARIGPLTHKLMIKDTDSVPKAQSELIYDELIRNGPTAAEAGIP